MVYQVPADLSGRGRLKPWPFEYRRANSVGEAQALLTMYGDDAKVLAGGQSLVPMMNLRLARPGALVDINALRELDYIRRAGATLRIGALTRHRTLELMRGPEVDGYGILAAAARWIGHYPIRTRGTFGGSLAHGDPTAEWCVLAQLLDASLVLVGHEGRRREVAIDDWFSGPLSTVCAEDELLVEVALSRPRPRAAICEHAQRSGDFGLVLAAVALDIANGMCTDVAVVLGGVGGAPRRWRKLEAALEGVPATPQTWRMAGALASSLSDPPTDLHASSEYRRHLVATLTEQAFADAMRLPETRPVK